MVDWLILGGLVASRWLMPVESAAAGETLPLVQITLLYAVFALWRRIREGRLWRPLGRGDWLVFCLVAAHVGSGLAVLIGGGQKRAALNLLWEWVGTGVLWTLVGQEIFRLRLLDRIFGALAITTVLLAGFGIWQNIVVYPQLRGLLDDYERLEANVESLSGPDMTKFRELRASLPVSYIQGDAAARLSFSQRVRGSQEPLGMFALANSFGGLLLVGGWMVWGRLTTTFRERKGRLGPALWGTGLLLILACLMLTKARTAWVGGLAGIVVWIALTLEGRSLRRLLMPAALAIGGLLVLVGIGLATGRLDAQTISEAPKSVRYRLEYWQSTLALLRDRPLMGSGLANFRPRYLQYKLPQSSEEILDPHNFVLDVWANAGMFGLIALLSLLVLTLQSMRTRPETAAATEEPAPPSGDPSPWWMSLGIGQVGMLFAAAALYLSGADPVSGLGWLLPAWWVAGILFEKTSAVRIPFAAYAAAWASYTIHLLGAGGIETPGLSQLWLLLAARMVWNMVEAPAPTPHVLAPSRGWALTAGAGGLAVACLLTALVPVVTAQAALRLGEEQLHGGQNLATAAKNFDEATRADPLDPDPWVQKSFLSEIRWQRAIDMHHFDEAIEQIAEARRRNPLDPYLVRMTGLLWLVRYERTHAIEDAKEAVVHLREAVERYPYQAAILADLARALAPVVPDEARNVARRAIAQDDLNRAYGHYDKMLPDSIREQLQGIAGTVSGPQAPDPPKSS